MIIDNMHRLFNNLFFYLSFSQSHAVNYKQLKVDEITSSDGLSHPSVTDLIQDQYEFMWFASQNGLNKFNGYSFQMFTHKKNDDYFLANNSIADVQIAA